MPSWMQFDTPSFMKSAPAATTMQFESEPAGAEARTSLGQTCRTPCTQTVTANEFTVSFTLPGYQPQTVPVRVVAAARWQRRRRRRASCRTRCSSNCSRLRPRPATRSRPRSKKKPKAAPRPAPTAMAPEPRRRPRAGLAVAAGPLKPLDFLDMTKAAAEGGRIRLRSLTCTRTGSLKRRPSGA